MTTAATEVTKVDSSTTEKVSEATKKSDDWLKYRPNPDMLVSRADTTADDNVGVYRPIKIAPTTMEDDKKTKKERDALRKEKDTLRKVRQSDYVKSLVDDLEERPEEVREIIGAESREFSKYKQKWEQRERQEEEIFSRATISKAEKKQIKRLQKASGLFGLADDFYDEFKTLPLGEDTDEPKAGLGPAISMGRKHKRQKRNY